MAKVTRQLFDEMRAAGAPARRKFMVATDSMEPLIMIGDTIEVSVGEPPHRFDVIAFWGQDRLVCHVLWHVNDRVLGHGEQVYTTCSLLARYPDLAIKQNQYLGRVTNYRLGLFDKLRLIWRFKRRGL